MSDENQLAQVTAAETDSTPEELVGDIQNRLKNLLANNYPGDDGGATRMPHRHHCGHRHAPRSRSMGG